MIKVTKEQKGPVLFVKLIGSIEENVNFDELLGPPNPNLEINCKEVSRINSIGVKAWIKYFQSCQKIGSKMKFTECSTAIVEQINLISNFICGGLVESILVPFSCGKCKKELAGLFKAEELKKLNMQIPSLKCTQCGGNAEFDDIPEEYLSFLAR